MRQLILIFSALALFTNSVIGQCQWDRFKADTDETTAAGLELSEAIDDNPDLIDAWEILDDGQVDEALRKDKDVLTSLDEYLKTFPGRTGDIETGLGSAANKTEYLQKLGILNHPANTLVTDIATKVNARAPHVLEVETNADGTFITRTRHVGGVAYNVEGFKGCHTRNALQEYIDTNGGTFDIKNKTMSADGNGVYTGQPVIYSGGSEYVKINGLGVEYEPGKLGGTASFFPDGWSNDKVKTEVEYAVKHNHGKVNPSIPNDNTYRGYSSDGSVEIHFYLNADGSIGSYFPKSN